jgi:hypothetical protein
LERTRVHSRMIIRSADRLAQDHTEAAIEKLAALMHNAENERDQISAANSLLDRGHGKPAQAIISIPASKKQQALLAAMSDEDLLVAIQGTELPRMLPSAPQPEQDPLLD